MKINFNRLTDAETKNIISQIFETALDVTNTKDNVSVNITIVGEKTIKALNFEHRNINKVTDVLSFPLEDDFESEEFLDNLICSDLGDIVICKRRAQKQAIEYGHSYTREICFLALHGLLHVLGYDHMTDEDAKQMFDLSDKILQKHNIGR